MTADIPQTDRMETTSLDIALHALTPLRVLIVFILFVIGAKLFTSYRKLQHIPGPWYVGVTPFWISYHTLKLDLYRAVSDSLEKNGKQYSISGTLLTM